MHSLLGNGFFFKWSDVYKSQLSAAVSHTQWWRIIGLTLTSLNLTKHYCSKCKNWSKIEYVINTGSIHVRNSCPGSVTTGMAWNGFLRDWCARGPVRFRGNRRFLWCQFQMRFTPSKTRQWQSCEPLVW